MTTARELELEKALLTLIEYTKSLPLVPSTYHAIKAAEKSLANKDAVDAFEGVKPPQAGKWHLLGCHPVAARLFGNTLLVTTSDLREKPALLSEFKEEVYDCLTNGFIVHMKPEFVRPDPIFQQFIGRQRAFHEQLSEDA